MSDTRSEGAGVSAAKVVEVGVSLDSPASNAIQLNIVNQIFKHRLH